MGGVSLEARTQQTPLKPQSQNPGIFHPTFLSPALPSSLLGSLGDPALRLPIILGMCPLFVLPTSFLIRLARLASPLLPSPPPSAWSHSPPTPPPGLPLAHSSRLPS